jgi:hypothetical protein
MLRQLHNLFEILAFAHTVQLDITLLPYVAKWLRPRNLLQPIFFPTKD